MNTSNSVMTVGSVVTRFARIVLLWSGLAFAAFAEQGTVTILNNQRVWHNGDYMVGNTGPFNSLTITNGGTLSNAFGYIGASSAAASNIAILTGTNSQWINAGSLTVGASGSYNRLLINNGARAQSLDIVLGAGGTAGNNRALVVGRNSRWDHGALWLGYAGSSNELWVADGGYVTGNDTRIGVTGAAAANRMVVTGTNSVWTPALLHIGSEGPRNSLIISNGGRVFGIMTYVGYNSSGNSVNVSGTGSVFAPGYFGVGLFGSDNRMTISDGGLVSGGGSIAVSGGSGNGVLITGSNSVWQGGAYVGELGASNFLEIVDGGTAQGHEFMIGRNNGQPGNYIRIRGGRLIGSLGAATGFLELDHGLLAANALNFRWPATARFHFHGGRLVTTNSVIDHGTSVFPLGTSVEHPAIWDIHNGANTLRASGGILLGQSAGVRSSISVSGPAASLALDGPVFLGSNTVTAGHGNIRVRDGATLFVGDLTTGRRDTGSLTNDGGVLVLSNPVSLLNLSENGIVITNGTIRVRDMANASSDLAAGYPIKYQGDNTLELDNATNAPVDLLLLQSNSSNAFSQLRLIGGATAWQATNLVIGAGGILSVSNTASTLRVHNGTVTITNGGRLLAGPGTGIGYVGFACNNSNNLVHVTGTNSMWSMADPLFVGCDGASNRLSITHVGQVVNGPGYVGFDPSSSGNTVQVSDTNSYWRNNGPLIVGIAGSDNALLITNGGAVLASSLLIGSNLLASGNAVRVKDGTLSVSGSIDVRRGILALDGGDVFGSSLLLTNGANSVFEFVSGHVSLIDAIVANGRTFSIGDGTAPASLQLGNRASSFVHGILVPSTATLSFRDRITGAVTNQGTLAPAGSGTGPAITGNLRLASSSTLRFVVAGSTHRALSVNGNAFIGGQLELALGGGFVPKPTNIVVLMQHSFALGSFQNVSNGARLNTADGLGSFAVFLNEANLYATDFRFDRDGDGVDDAWAMQFFGHSPLTVAERNADPDGDGVGNYSEFLAGTDPTNAASVLRITWLRKTVAGFALRFNTVSNRSCSIWHSTNLSLWRKIAAPVFQTITTNVVEWEDNGSQTGGTAAGRGFYKLSTD